jgi:hypothetical protein
MARASTAARGYDRRHEAERRRWAPQVDAGLVDCWRCGGHLEPGRPWHLGHDDVDRTVWRGPEHVTCNLRAGGRNGAMVSNASRQRKTVRTSRNW